VSLETQAINAWRDWALYQQHGRCSACQEWRYVGRRRNGGRWLCVACFDQGAK
jgi:formylmethanofuran dehydrogenase subunit E